MHNKAVRRDRMTILSVAFPFAPVRHDIPGGAEQVLLALDGALHKSGHQSVVVAQSGSEISGTLCPTRAWSGPLEPVREQAWREHAEAIRGAIERWSPDIVHYHGLDFQKYIARGPEPPALVTLHMPAEFYPDGIETDSSGIFYHCVSRSQRNRFHSHHPGMLDVIPNGVDTEFFHPRVGQRRYVVCIGRICPEKGFHLAMDAARRSGTPLLLAGDVFDYRAHQEYFRSEIEPRLGPEVRFLGPIGPWKKRRLLAGARCVLIPSLVEETSSLVAMEALACGTPAVARSIGALPEIVEVGRTGFFADTTGEFAARIGDCGQIREEDCRAAAIESFSVQRMTDTYLETYRDLLANVSCSA